MSACVRRFLRGMQREPQESDAAYARERRHDLGLRRHATAEGLASGEKRHRRGNLRRCLDSRTHRGIAPIGWVDTPRFAFHVWKLVAQRRDAERAELVRDALEKRVAHAGAGTMPKDQASRRTHGQLEKSGDALRSIDWNRHVQCERSWGMVIR